MYNFIVAIIKVSCLFIFNVYLRCLFLGATTLVPSSGQMQQQAAENNPAAGQRAANAQQQPAGGNLNTVRTVPNNLHNLGAMPAQTSSADPNVVVTTHHTFAGNQVINSIKKI